MSRAQTPQRKHEEIAESLTQDILVGQYRTGERLPSERDLAARFEANRGAVREAMKKLEQLGLARIQQGGARVAPIQQASLDVIGHLLAIGDLPDESLVDQIMQVMISLVALAAESATRHASDAQLHDIRAKLAPMLRSPKSLAIHAEARYELMQAIMHASGNLVCQIIAHSLLLQIMPRTAPLAEYVELDIDVHRRFAEKLDLALQQRDVAAVRAAFESMATFNREVTRRAFAAIRASGTTTTAARRSQ